MALSIEDPDNPDKRVDALAVLRRNPDTPLPPILMHGLLKRDGWTRQEALMILAGYSPDNTVHQGLPGALGAGVIYLDGTTFAMLQRERLAHPLDHLMPSRYLELVGYANGERLDERRTPYAWIEWALSKDFRPYWLDYAVAKGWARVLSSQGVAAAATQRADAAQANKGQGKAERARRNEDIVAFIRDCRSRKQMDFIKRASAKFGLADSTIRKIWEPHAPRGRFPALPPVGAKKGARY